VTVPILTVTGVEEFDIFFSLLVAFAFLLVPLAAILRLLR